MGFSTNPCSVMFHLICALFMPHRFKRCKVSQDDHIDGVCVQNKDFAQPECIRRLRSRQRRSKQLLRQEMRLTELLHP